jgi:hypothetical protein
MAVVDDPDVIRETGTIETPAQPVFVEPVEGASEEVSEFHR